MHILITVNAAWNVLNFRRPLVQALIDDGHRVTVLAPPDDAVPELKSLGCSFRSLEMDVKDLNPLGALKLQRRFAQSFIEERADLVLSFTIKNNIFGARAANSLYIPFLPNITGLGTAFLSGKLLQAVTEHLYRSSFFVLPLVLFQNKDDRDLFLARRLVRPDQARLVPGSGIDLIHFTPEDKPRLGEGTVFLMIARLLRDKGVFEFVDAAKAIKSRYANVKFQILGDTSPENRSAVESKTLLAWAAEGAVEFLGTTRDVRPAIAAANCVVLPSYREGAPRTLIEAAAMGRPVITTDVPGCRDVVDRDVTGLLCEARSVSSLESAIERFLELPLAVQETMGQLGRAKMEREYDQSIVVDCYRESIAHLMNRRLGAPKR